MELYIENKKKNVKLPLYLEDNIKDTYDCIMFKIILIEEGSTILQVNDKSIVLSAPALLCLNEKESLRVQKKEGLVIRSIYFNPSIVNSYFNLENVYSSLNSVTETVKLDHFYFIPFINRSSKSEGLIEIGPLTSKRISTVFNSLKDQITNYSDSYWRCRNRSFLIEILFIIQHCYSEKDIISINIQESTASINDVLLYLHLNYYKKITIEELIDEFNTNRNTLNKKFKMETGLSPIQYTIKLRIKVACMLLRDTKLPISEIMKRVGFDDASHWGRTFKLSTGLSPVDYRKSRTDYYSISLI